MTMPGDYTQQLHAYLQAWRQLLESAAALLAAMPLPGVAPGLLPVPPTPAAPADPTAQLFAHLQAWRQHLEQTVGAAGAPAPSPQDPTATAHAKPAPRPSDSTPPADPGGSKTAAQSAPGSTGPQPPTKVQARIPKNPFGGQIPVEGALRAAGDRQPAVAARGDQIPRPPALEFGQQITPLMNRVTTEAGAAPVAGVKALFRGLEERAQRFE